MSPSRRLHLSTRSSKKSESVLVIESCGALAPARATTLRIRKQIELRRGGQRFQLLPLGALARSVADCPFGREFGFLEVAQNFLGSFENRFRHTRQPRHLNTVTLIRATLNNPSQKNNLILPFTHRDVEVAHPRQTSGSFSQFMIMRRKERLGPDLIVQR